MNEVLSLEGVPVDRLWEVAREAGLNLSMVMAIAGGHTRCGGKVLPVGRAHLAARKVELYALIRRVQTRAA